MNIKIESELANELYRDLAKPTVVKLGKAFETVMGIVDSLLIPVKAWSEKRNIIYEHNMRRLATKLEEIKEEDIIDIAPELGIPVLERLSYTKSYEISEMFINLLASAASKKTVDQAQPAFLNIINNLSVDEARILSFLSAQNFISIPTVMFKATHSLPQLTHISNVNPVISQEVELLFPHNDTIYVSNMLSLGLFIFYEERCPVNEITRIDQKEDHFNKLKMEYDEWLINTKDKDYHKSKKVVGSYILTELGGAFIAACTNKQP